MVKNLPMQETWVRSLGHKDLLEKEIATHSSILAWEVSWTEEPGRLQSMGLQRVKTCLSARTRALRSRPSGGQMCAYMHQCTFLAWFYKLCK